MKKAVFLALITALALAVPGSADAGGRTLGDLRAELEALTDAITTQMKLLEICERVNRPDEAVATKQRIRDLVATQQKVLAEMTALLGGGAPQPPDRPSKADLPGIGGRVGQPLVAKRTPPRPVTEVSKHIGLALDWLRNHQNPAGFWDTDGFGVQCKLNKCDGPGHALYDPGVTGLATLAFLGAGETHKSGRYKNTVKLALQYLKQVQDPEGCFGPRTTNHFTYNHAACAQAMIEAYALTGSPLFKYSAQIGVDFILKAQNPYLAWRYGVRPQDNDTSVTGWMTAALYSAKNADLRVGGEPFTGALAWIDKATEPKYGRVGYTSRGTGPARAQQMMDKFPADKSEALTAAGIAIRFFCGQDLKQSELALKGVALIDKLPPRWNTATGEIDMYYWFWGTQALSRVGGPSWDGWAGEMSHVIATAQRQDGDEKGSFDPAGPWGHEGGRVYSTAMMTMCAEIIEHHK